MRILRVLRVAAYAFGACSIFWFFFSIIGITIGVLYFLLMRDFRWRAHGLALAACAATSELVARTGSAVEPLLLAMRSGPPLFGAYLLGWLLGGLLTRGRLRAGLRSRLRWRWSGLRARLAHAVPPWAGALLTVVAALVPVALWASVSIHLGVLFDNAPRMLWVHAPSTPEAGERFTVTVQAWDAFERLSAVYQGTIGFAVQSYGRDGGELEPGMEAELPGEHTFTGRKRGSDMAYRVRDGRDNGRHAFRARIRTPGIHYLVVQDSM
ncbi:MAG: hypothetical protein JW820_01090, partial [Spirochaetales bacterium]|nr:hypothetical protein [Spirochaetales bacterium]